MPILLKVVISGLVIGGINLVAQRSPGLAGWLAAFPMITFGRSRPSLDYSPRPGDDHLLPSDPTPVKQRMAVHRVPYQFVNNPG